MSRPLVSVVIPAFNAAMHLRATLDSVFAQTLTDFEVILVDDGSTDDTLPMARSYSPRVQVLEQRHGGPGAARNRGIMAGDSTYVALCDADDLWATDKLQRQVEAMESEPAAALCCTDFSLSAEPERARTSRFAAFNSIAADEAFYGLLSGNFVATSSVLLRRDALSPSGLFDGSLRGSEDLDLWLRLVRRQPPTILREVLTFLREHPGRTTRTLAYQRDQLRATRGMLARWGDDPRARRLLRRRLREVLWNLAYAEKLRGETSAARRAYWQCVLAGSRPLSALARAAALCVMPLASSGTPEQLLAASAQ